MSTQAMPSLRTRWLAVAVLAAAQVMIILDQNIVNIALPAIRDDLHISQSNLVWTVNAYVIPFGGVLLLAGRLGDLISRKRVFLAGLTLFAAASAAAATADTQGFLLGARFAQGVGGAIASAGLLGMVVMLMPEPEHRPKAIGAFGLASSGGAALGTVVGGVLTETLGWEAVFLINVPLGLAVGLLAARLLRDDRGIGLRQGADVLGALLVTSGVMLAVYTLVEIESHGWTSPRLLGLGALAAALIAGFFARQAKAANPLVPLRILFSRNVAAANLVQALMVGAMFGFMFFTVLYLQQVLGLTPLTAALAFLPVPVIIMTASITVVPRLLTRFGPRPLIVTGLAAILAGFLLLTQIRAEGAYAADVLGAMIALAAGFSVTMPALMSLGMADSRPEDAGVTSGLFNTAQQVGGAVGLAVLSTAVAARTRTLLDQGAAEAEALTGGYRLSYALAAGFVAIALLIAATALKPRASATAEPAAAPVA